MGPVGDVISSLILKGLPRAPLSHVAAGYARGVSMTSTSEKEAG